MTFPASEDAVRRCRRAREEDWPSPAVLSTAAQAVRVDHESLGDVLADVCRRLEPAGGADHDGEHPVLVDAEAIDVPAVAVLGPVVLDTGLLGHRSGQPVDVAPATALHHAALLVGHPAAYRAHLRQ